MSDWYFVEQGERQGPISKEEVISFLNSGRVNSETYLWTKGMENWEHLSNIAEFAQAPEETFDLNDHEVTLSSQEEEGKTLFIRIGIDRGSPPTDYGPFDLSMIKKLYQENRINAKTLIYINGMTKFKVLGDFVDFNLVFQEAPPIIAEDERRAAERKPFIARMFIQNQAKVFEGVCRDVSIGGMQVLVDQFPGHVGEKIDLNVHPENSDLHFVASGEIVRKLEGGQGFSFRFLSLKEEARQAIESYIKSQNA